MKDSDRYQKIVERSDEDSCYVGRCPSLMLGGVHGDDEVKVYADLCKVVEEWIAILKADGKPLPPPTIKYVYEKQNRQNPGNKQKLAS